jgi:hypothetical protein
MVMFTSTTRSSSQDQAADLMQIASKASFEALAKLRLR